MNFDLIDLGRPGGEQIDGPPCLDLLQNCERIAVSSEFIEQITTGSRNNGLSLA